MACTKALSAFSWTAPALPGFVYSRVICRTFGMELLDWSCADPRQQQPSASETVRSERLSEFIDANLPVCEWNETEELGPRTNQGTTELRHGWLVPNATRAMD